MIRSPGHAIASEPVPIEPVPIEPVPTENVPPHPVPSEEVPLDEAMELMHFAFRQVIEAPDRALAERGFSRLHHRILYVAAHNPRIVVGDVVGLLGVTKQALHRPIRQLCEAELMTIEQGDDDRRTRSLQLTREGRRFERRLARMQHRIFRKAFENAGGGAEKGWRAVMDLIGGRRRLRV